MRLGEGGGIEDDQVVLGAGGFLPLEEIEDVLGHGLDAQLVALRIGGDEGGGILADLDGGDFFRAGPGAGEGEGALVGKAIQHPAPGGPGGHLAVVFHLVQVEAGLLPMEQVEFEAQPEDFHGLGGLRAVEQAGAEFQALGAADGGVVPLHDGVIRHAQPGGQVLQRLHDQAAGADPWQG